MSVIRSKRSVSDMQFLATARELQLFTIRKCVNFPKRYTFYVSQPIAAIATRIYENAKRGNSVFPTNQHEAQIRRDFFIQVSVDLQNLISQIELASELFGVDENALMQWMSLIDSEIRLIKAVMSKDKDRYKTLPG